MRSTINLAASDSIIKKNVMWYIKVYICLIYHYENQHVHSMHIFCKLCYDSDQSSPSVGEVASRPRGWKWSCTAVTVNYTETKNTSDESRDSWKDRIIPNSCSVYYRTFFFKKGKEKRLTYFTKELEYDFGFLIITINEL